MKTKLILGLAIIFMAFIICGCAGPGLQPIQRAAFDHNKAEVDRLLKQDGNINHRFGEGRETLLYAFAFEGDADMVEFLLSRGADPIIGASRKGYDTPLHKAAEKGHTNVVNVLLNHGVNVDIKNRSQATPLMSAAWSRQPDAVGLLIQRGANVNARDSSRRTALFMGVLNQPPVDENYRRTVKLLLQNSAQVNVSDNAGCTPLTMAARVGDVETVRLLLDAGANLAAKDVNDETALMIATRLGNIELQKAISNYLENSHQGANISREEVQAVLDSIEKACLKKDAAAVVANYASNAVITVTTVGSDFPSTQAKYDSLASFDGNLELGFAVYDNFSFQRKDVSIEIAPDGQTAQCSFTEIAHYKYQGKKETDITKESISLAKFDGKVLITKDHSDVKTTQ